MFYFFVETMCLTTTTGYGRALNYICSLSRYSQSIRDNNTIYLKHTDHAFVDFVAFRVGLVSDCCGVYRATRHDTLRPWHTERHHRRRNPSRRRRRQRRYYVLFRRSFFIFLFSPPRHTRHSDSRFPLWAAKRRGGYRHTRRHTQHPPDGATSLTRTGGTPTFSAAAAAKSIDAT